MHIELFSPPPPPPDNDNVLGSNQCRCLPKAELRFTRKILDHPSGSCLYLYFSSKIYVLKTLTPYLMLRFSRYTAVSQ